MSRTAYEPLVGETVTLGGPTEVSDPLVILVAHPLALDLQRKDLPEGEGEERVEGLAVGVVEGHRKVHAQDAAA